MKKNKCKGNTSAEKEFVFEFEAGTLNCVLKVPLQFPVQENISDLHGRLMLLHKIPCYIENGEIATGAFVLMVFSCLQMEKNFVSFPSAFRTRSFAPVS